MMPINKPVEQAYRVIRGHHIVKGVHKGELAAVSGDNRWHCTGDYVVKYRTSRY